MPVCSSPFKSSSVRVSLKKKQKNPNCCQLHDLGQHYPMSEVEHQTISVQRSSCLARLSPLCRWGETVEEHGWQHIFGNSWSLIGRTGGRGRWGVQNEVGETCLNGWYEVDQHTCWEALLPNDTLRQWQGCTPSPSSRVFSRRPRANIRSQGCRAELHSDTSFSQKEKRGELEQGFDFFCLFICLFFLSWHEYLFF